MRDIPVFTTPAGVATLYLKNVPFTKEAYIKIHDASEYEKLLEDCCDFCRSAGAEHVYATGHDRLESFTLFSSLLLMKRENNLPESDAFLIPVQKETMEQWRKLYNEKMLAVPNAMQISYLDAKKYLERGSCYFVHRNGSLLGIGIASGKQIDAVASVIPGAGKDVLISLSKALSDDTIEILVADNNYRALKLYRSLDFLVTDIVEKWYKIF